MMIEEPQNQRHQMPKQKGSPQEKRKNLTSRNLKTKQPNCSPKRGEVGGKNQKRQLNG
jgi:hypothetical protein